MSANAKDLITIARAYQGLPAALVNTIDTNLQTWVTAVSDAIEKYCRRKFYSLAYDEIYSGNGYDTLLLRAYPIQSIESLRFGPTPVMQVSNTSTTTNQQ